jgi:hypothetical protein
LKSRFMHWHKWSPVKSSFGSWSIECVCGKRIGCLDDKQVKEYAWKMNVTCGNAKANYINNGVLKTEQQLGIKTS